MKEKILQTLTDLRKYALGQGYDVAIFYHEEDSYLMRFANSAISLNTNEHLIRLEITAFSITSGTSASISTATCAPSETPMTTARPPRAHSRTSSPASRAASSIENGRIDMLRPCSGRSGTRHW